VKPPGVLSWQLTMPLRLRAQAQRCAVLSWPRLDWTPTITISYCRHVNTLTLGAPPPQAVTKDVPEAELERAKAAAVSSVLMNLESRAVVAEDIGRQVLTYGHRCDPTPHGLAVAPSRPAWWPAGQRCRVSCQRAS
jgi:hypothetical protein